ncbi:MAG TPA: 3'(2'),5'-bisphosphate nucleotidase CysQ [Actinobacteria bacterium]|nr:3'(2'),5'-bisphosphate nucleotidase CysQ [Actinomycetota bacterium]
MRHDLSRIEQALRRAGETLDAFTAGAIESVLKEGGDPVTAADLAVNEVLAGILPEQGDGWLSEETADDPSRLSCRRVWVVDPVDGTREFIAGIPEWCVSVGLVEDGMPVAGGIYAPTSDRLILGAVGEGVTLNGEPTRISPVVDLRGALVLASRSETKRGEWERFHTAPISVRNLGSVAYKLGLVAAGLADATWTLVPKNEWDVAAGAALVTAAGGIVFGIDGKPVRFNRPNPLLSGFVATAPGIQGPVRRLLGISGAR